MSNAFPSRLGQVNQTGNERELFLKIFTGEVMQAFQDKNKFLDKTQVRTISHGKSASFALVGKIGAEYHTPGTEILGTKVNKAEQVITIDDILISHAFIAEIDEAMNHFDVRAPYSREMGRKLADAMDRNIGNEIIRAARSTNAIADGDMPDGSRIIDANLGSADFETKVKSLAQAIFAGAELLDEKDIPEDQRYVAFKPSEYYLLAQNLDMINTLYGGQGALAEGNIIKIAGVDIIKHNKVPDTDDTATNTFHGIDASNTVGMIWHPSAVGTVKLRDISTRLDYDARRLGHLMVSKYLVGHGVIRPESAIELATTATIAP